jgi:hypothetical protein
MLKVPTLSDGVDDIGCFDSRKLLALDVRTCLGFLELLQRAREELPDVG